jgi:hypothetical protein
VLFAKKLSMPKEKIKTQEGTLVIPGDDILQKNKISISHCCKSNA